MLSAIEKPQAIGLLCDGHALPLERIDVEVELAIPVAITRQCQRYRNTLGSNIEIRYVFPAPFEATLLGLEIHIGDETLHGTVKAKETAEREYENALVDGDSPFLLRQLDDGLYHISLGNITADEVVAITVTWAETLRWSGNEISYRLPNVIGIHYGNPQTAGIELADQPRHSPFAAYEQGFTANLTGDLANATVTSPTHRICSSKTAKQQLISLISDDWLDRSLKLNLTLDAPPSLVAWSAPDGEHHALLACCYAPSTEIKTGSHHLTLLIDGSGSMSGVSISQARAAAIEIVRSLANEDTCTLAAFGSSTRMLSDACQPVRSTREHLLQCCNQLDANLGGTEMMAALRRMAELTPEGGDILLITDGQLYVSDHEIQQLLKHRQRIFVIGVGHSTSEKALRKLANDSGAFCELVSPNESMASHIYSHFRRIRSARLQHQIDWPCVVNRSKEPLAIFGGDTAIFYARTSQPERTALEMRLNDSSISGSLRPATGMLAELLPRLVAKQVLPKDNIRLAREEAVRYQLVTEHTAMIAVHPRGQSSNAIALPKIVELGQMAVCTSMPVACMSLSPSYLDIDMYIAPQPPESSKTLNTPPSLCLQNREHEWISNINDLLKSGHHILSLLSFKLLPNELIKNLQHLASRWEEKDIILALIKDQLEKLPTAELANYRNVHAAIRGLLKTSSHPDSTLVNDIRSLTSPRDPSTKKTNL